MKNVKAFFSDFSVSAMMAGFIAVAISYAGPLVVVLQAAKSVHMNDLQISSWIWAISIGSGLSAILLNLWFKAPIITAWSTPGAALLATSMAQYDYSDVIGAFLLSAVMIVVLGSTGLFSWIMERIPKEIVSAMLAGVLLKFGIGLFSALGKSTFLVIAMAGTYLAGRRLFARYAIPATLAVGVCILYTSDFMLLGPLSFAPALPRFTQPTFSFQAFVGLAIPLCFVTMASQNAPGLAVLRNAGYETPANPLVTTTGVISLILAPFGAHGINLAAITAAICTGREAHHAPSRRYIAGFFCGLFYILIGTFGATLASLFTSLPEDL
jgi:benzoate membrane transport protein